MKKKRSLANRIANGIFAIPTVAQIWSKQKAIRTEPADAYNGIPFTRLRKPLGACRLALVTTAGIHLPEQQAFDMANPEGDASYREIPANADLDRLVITHNYYDHRDADRDPNTVFPLKHLRDLVEAGVLGGLASVHFGFMGHIDGAQLPVLIHKTAPEIAEKLRADQIDVALLTPA